MGELEKPLTGILWRRKSHYSVPSVNHLFDFTMDADKYRSFCGDVTVDQDYSASPVKGRKYRCKACESASDGRHP